MIFSSKPTLSPKYAKRRLRLMLLFFAALLALPFGFLGQRIYSQLALENFLTYFESSQSLNERTEAAIREILNAENQRQVSDYNFDRQKIVSVVPGLVGYFEIGRDGALSTSVESPSLPQERLRAATRELVARANERRAGATRSAASSLVAKDAAVPLSELSKSKIDASQYEQQLASNVGLQKKQLQLSEMKEKALAITGRRSVVNQAGSSPAAAGNISELADSVQEGTEADLRIGTRPQRVIKEESLALSEDIEALRIARTDDKTLTFYRRVWNNSSIQGFVVSEDEFFRGIIEPIRETSTLSSDVALVLGYSGAIISRFDIAAGSQSEFGRVKVKSIVEPFSSDGFDTLIFRSFLPAPLENYEMLFTAKELGIGASGSLINLVFMALALILPAGLYGVYSIGAKQIDLAKERSDFVSAVSHELRTPLTSIRMYSEMLREDWVQDETKKRSYYEFIFSESERLSRLISNILQLSKLSNSQEKVEFKQGTPMELLGLIKARVESQVVQQGFELTLSEQNDSVLVEFNEDGLVQIFVNLIDNALKFSGKEARKELQLGYRIVDSSNVEFYVRDFGPGVPQAQLKRIFELFYRGQDELTRTTPGTGIGLALVRELARQMNGSVTVVNREPGAEFILRLPVVSIERVL